MHRLLHMIIGTLTALLLTTSCGSGRAGNAGQGDTLRLKYATLLTMVRHQGYTAAYIRNPWDTTKVLHSYALVDSRSEVPADLPEELTVVRTPLRNALIYSAVHVGLAVEMDRLNRIGGVCDAQYIQHDSIRQWLKTGRVADCGNSMAPNLERIMQFSPDAIMLSPYQDSKGYGKLQKMNIPIIECADYMETSPLGRAEWMKFYGMLLGADGDTLFETVEREYLALKAVVAKKKTHPTVLCDTPYGNVWYQPARNSTIGQLIMDAGATTHFFPHSEGQSGSMALAPEKVVAMANDANFWLVRYNNGGKPYTLATMAQENAAFELFKAMRKGDVFGCNTDKVRFYDETPFHPQWLLANFISIFHPDMGVEPEHVYYTRMH